jgi:2-polyprenyl-6-hydroxyphenyl methylase/3-demethylubiquinone-9 3-methyltransferase
MRMATCCRIAATARNSSTRHFNLCMFQHCSSRYSSSFSKEEVAKFSNMSASWWDNRQNPLIAMNPVRLKYVQQHVVTSEFDASTNNNNNNNYKLSPLHGLISLDVGCGGGLLSESLARLGCAKVVAIDPSEPLVVCAKAHSEGLHIDYRGGTTIEQLAADETFNNQFDVICILEVLEHVPNVDSLLKAASKLLKKDTGRLFISTLNPTIQSHILAIVGAEYVMGYLPPGTHDYSKFLSPAVVKQKLISVGLEEAAPPMGMVVKGLPPPFGSSWQWEISESDLDVNWIGVYKHV